VPRILDSLLVDFRYASPIELVPEPVEGSRGNVEAIRPLRTPPTTDWRITTTTTIRTTTTPEGP